ncbi:MAG: NAD-glutamate dehydrogenase [Hyphomicrobiales bacterium]|nr:NAD-glutamate dehydrogenase [Hyphomicrobiales bacterium]
MASQQQVVEGVGTIVAALGQGTPQARFAELLYAAVSADGIAPKQAGAIAGETQRFYEFLSERTAGQHKLRVRPSASHDMTLVEIVNDDMPFLVDSVMGEIQARGLVVRLVVHPILQVARDASGRLQTIHGTAGPNGADGRRESVIAVHLDPIPAGASEELAGTLSAILSDVRIAVADWRAMLQRLERAVQDLEASNEHMAAEEKAESLAFLRWLHDGHFTLLGMREYRAADGASADRLMPVAETSLGLLRDPSRQVVAQGGTDAGSSGEAGAPPISTAPLIISKSGLASRVHRRTQMDYIGVKLYGDAWAGAPRSIGELRIIGLFTSRAYTAPARQIPFVRHTVAKVLAGSGFPPDSHAGKALVNVLETFPRDELFQIGERDLAQWTAAILDLDLRPRVRLLARNDRFGRFVSVLLFAPRERYTTAARERIVKRLEQVFDGRIASLQPFFPEGPLVRVHAIITREPGPAPRAVDIPALEDEITDILRNWRDRVEAGLASQGPSGMALATRYLNAFPAGYADTYPPARAIEDMRRIERLHATGLPVAIDFHRDGAAAAHRLRATIYRFGEPIRLSERVPLLENFGFFVVDERSWQVCPTIDGAQRPVALHDMIIETADGAPLDLANVDQRLEDAFIAVFRQAAENDTFNRLVITAGATWHEAAIVRAYASYMRQLQVPLGLRAIAEAMIYNSGIVRDLLELFHIRFNPDHAAGSDRGERERLVRQRIDGALGGVASLDEDRMLRHMLNLIGVTLRTNVYQSGSDGQPPATIAFKLDSKAVEAAPLPRPYREIWVYSPRVEGIHLRFAPIARGGLRWSDRAQDFRTEVLGLVKAQLVKNAVIVPSGAKGGFYPKQLPRSGSREDVMKEGIASYRGFVDALLSITDNIVSGAVVPPDRVLRHDGDDPYLVVAADKGTATFSDYANEIALARGFWLGDAFASGGSAGYDHKKMAITARGAWECVRRHFREMDIDIQTTPFSVIGVGDMSGDVFGNGMLLSPKIRLLAAFDHRDIFIDPDPDPAVSFAERRRIFDLPRSSWQDYDKSKISAGGGVFSRSTKSIDLSPQMRALLGVSTSRLTPAEVLKALLRIEADLLWLGGIGTYVKASGESDEQAGDRANDAIRATASELRVKVIGEGANLGLTQRARIELALRGCRLNTDFIDNSAGVNSSDQEVNIKIALGRATRSGELGAEERKAFLATMTDEVALACLRNNQQQSLVLSLAERRGAAGLGADIQLIGQLEARGFVNRAVEALPQDAELLERRARGRGLTRPELAVLLSYAKIALFDDLLHSTVPEEARLEPWLTDYFPVALRTRYAADVRTHQLRREIIATAVTNAVVNRTGPSFVFRLGTESGRPPADVVRAVLAARYVFDTPMLSDRIDALAGVTSARQLELHGLVQSLLTSAAGWFVRDGTVTRLLDAVIDLHKAGAAQLAGALDGILPAEARAAIEQQRMALTNDKIPDDLARFLARLDHLRRAPQITSIAAATQRQISEAGRVYFAIARHFGLDRLAARAAATPAADTWDRLAIASAESQIEAAHARLAMIALRSVTASTEIDGWLASDGQRLQALKSRMEEALAEPTPSVSRLTVAAAMFSDGVKM